MTIQLYIFGGLLPVLRVEMKFERQFIDPGCGNDLVNVVYVEVPEKVFMRQGIFKSFFGVQGQRPLLLFKTP